MATVVYRVVVLCLAVVVAEAILIGKARRKFEPASNIVPVSDFQFPVDRPESCKTDLSVPGICVEVRHCVAARRAIRTGNHPVRCGWKDSFVPMVCCHPDQVRHPKIVFRPNRRRYYHYDIWE